MVTLRAMLFLRFYSLLLYEHFQDNKTFISINNSPLNKSNSLMKTEIA